MSLYENPSFQLPDIEVQRNIQLEMTVEKFNQRYLNFREGNHHEAVLFASDFKDKTRPLEIFLPDTNITINSDQLGSALLSQEAIARDVISKPKFDKIKRFSSVYLTRQMEKFQSRYPDKPYSVFVSMILLSGEEDKLNGLFIERYSDPDSKFSTSPISEIWIVKRFPYSRADSPNSNTSLILHPRESLVSAK